MASRRKKLPLTKDNRSRRTPKFLYQNLEDRIAPGSLIDMLGIAGVGGMLQGWEKGGTEAISDDWLQRIPRGQEKTSVPAGRSAYGGFHTSDSDHRVNDFDQLGRRLSDCVNERSGSGKNVSSESAQPIYFFKGLSSDQENLVNRVKDARATNRLRDAEILASVEWSELAAVVPETFGDRSAKLRLTGSADLPELKTMGDGATAPELPLSIRGGGSGVIQPGVPLSFDSAFLENRVGAGFESFFADGTLESALSLSSDAFAAAFGSDFNPENLQRIPSELRGRHDEYFARQSLVPFSLSSSAELRQPASRSLVASPAEYDPMRGVLFSYASYPTVVTDMVKELTEDPATDDIAYVVVNSINQRTNATNSFINAGADLSRVEFFVQPMNSVWIRDYGPHFITIDGAPGIVDSHYYPTRPLDSFVPTLVGRNNFNVPTYDMGLYFSGGNFQPGPNRSGFVTALVNADNPTADGFNPDLILELHQQFLGIDTLHVLPQLPSSVDGTGHIDMWMYLVDHDTVVISEFLPGSNATAIQITNNAVGYMESLGFNVFRTPAWNAGGTHFTYANAFRVNNRIFVPVYGTGFKPGGNSAYNSRDDLAIQAWQAAAGPDVEIIPIQCSQIITASGAIHCIVKQVPRYTGNAPAVHIVSPTGGEILTPNVPFKLEWSAIDKDNVDPAEIRIYVAYGKSTFQHIATTTDTGSYLWTPGGRIVNSDAVRFKLVATSATGSSTEVLSRLVSLSNGNLTTYDFSSGAGVNKFAYGSQTATWANINANPSPVSAQLSSLNYSRLATSNATGGSGDTNRYIAPTPSPISNESTHLFTFQLANPISSMAQLEVLWEGYANFATQVELYVWDQSAQNWGNGAGLVGMNRYMDSWSGNIDGHLTGAIRSDFSRYVDGNGWIRFLVYNDRPGAVGSAGQGITSYHDYMSVTVKERQSQMA